MAVPVVTWEQYAADWSGLHGGVDLGVRPGVRRWLRLGFVVARWLQRARVPAGAVTALGLLSSIAVVVVVTHGSGGILRPHSSSSWRRWPTPSMGRWPSSVGIRRVSGMCTTPLSIASVRHARLIALWRIGAAGHVAVAAGALAWLHEYVRSRGNAAGMTEITAVTVGERPTRIMVTIGGLLLAGVAESFNPHVAAGIAAITTATWIVLGLIGITQLLAAVHRALAGRSWPTWRPAGTPSATTPSAPPAAVPAFTVGPATPTDPGPIGAAERPDGSFNERSGDRSFERSGHVADERSTPEAPSASATAGGRDASAGDWNVRDSGISEVVSYAASSADEPSEPSPDIALREPTLDDLLGDAGARVRSAVGKYGRSVTVYRSQAAGAPNVDAATMTTAYGSRDATDAADIGDDTDAGHATEVIAAEAPGTTVVGAEAPGVEVIGTAADADVSSGNHTVTKDGGTGGTGGERTRGNRIGRGGSGGRASGTEPGGRWRAETGESASGRSRASKIRAHSRARLRFTRRSRGGSAKSMAEETGPAPGPATSSGSDPGGDG